MAGSSVRDEDERTSAKQVTTADTGELDRWRRQRRLRWRRRGTRACACFSMRAWCVRENRWPWIAVLCRHHRYRGGRPCYFIHVPCCRESYTTIRGVAAAAEVPRRVGVEGEKRFERDRGRWRRRRDLYISCDRRLPPRRFTLFPTFQIYIYNWILCNDFNNRTLWWARNRVPVYIACDRINDLNSSKVLSTIYLRNSFELSKN